MDRRNFLLCIGSGVALTGCGTTGTSINTNLSSVAADVADIAGGLLGILPMFGTMSGLSTTSVATIGQAIADLQNLSQQVQAAADATAAQPIIQQVEADVNAIIKALGSTSSIPTSIASVLNAVAVLLPIIEMAVNLVVPAKMTARATRSGMTPEQARQTLRGATKKFHAS